MWSFGPDPTNQRDMSESKDTTKNPKVGVSTRRQQSRLEQGERNTDSKNRASKSSYKSPYSQRTDRQKQSSSTARKQDVKTPLKDETSSEKPRIPISTMKLEIPSSLTVNNDILDNIQNLTDAIEKHEEALGDLDSVLVKFDDIPINNPVLSSAGSTIGETMSENAISSDSDIRTGHTIKITTDP